MSLSNGLNSKPSLAYLNQIVVAPQTSGVSPKVLKAISDSMRNWDINFVLPIVCLTDQEDSYQLLTGLPIYEAAKAAELEKIWVFLIAEKHSEAQKVTTQVSLQSKLNESIVSDDIKEKFIIFLDTAKIDELTQLNGIKDKYARLIIEKRPYKSSKDLEKLGKKRPENWLKAYCQWS